MQFTTALIAAMSFTAISAAPAMESRNSVPSLTFQISNDLTGKQASATTLGDGLARNLVDLFKGTTIVDASGAIVATSVQLTGGFTDGTRCFFQNGNTVVNFNGKETYVRIAGEKDKPIPVYMNGFNIQCV